MALKYSTTARTNRMTQLSTDIGSNAVVKLCSGTRPANVAAALTGNTVVTMAGNASGFGLASSGVLTANAIANATAALSGTVTHFRVFKSDGTTAVIDGDVANAGADLNLDNPVIASGQTVGISSFVLTASGA